MGQWCSISLFIKHKLKLGGRIQILQDKTFKACQSIEKVMATASRDAEITHVGRTLRGTTIEVNAYCDTL
jgi:hypothetical protein